MSVSLKTSGTWTSSSLNNRPAALVGSPQLGDRYFLWVTWKLYTYVIDQLLNDGTMAGWTQLTQYADGTTAGANGTGSVKVACFYKDWASGDVDLNIHWTTGGPNVCGFVMQLWQKDAGDTWLTPTIYTAPWPSQSSGTLSATSSVSSGGVSDGAVVIHMLATAATEATFTFPTNGIDVASGITWNGNMIQSPASSLSTATGNDIAANLGYRLVTNGNPSGAVTLRSTVSSLSSASTGAALWVAQSIVPAPTTPPSYPGGMFLVVN